MSLLDALLLESPKIDVWLAARTDDSIGLGTASEPYNAGVRLDSVQNTITGFTIAVTQVTATCVNSYSAGDVVVITGAADSAYNGTFQLLSANATTFHYVVNRLPTVASGTARVKKVLERRFDSVMNDPTKIGPNVCIHLGPGVFVTAGYYENPVDTGIGWQLKSGMSIVGSGMDVTKVLLTSSASALPPSF